MIAYLKGELVTRLEDKVIIEVNGIGYGVYVPSTVMDTLPNIGTTIHLYTYMNVREDVMQLFGFASQEELDIYKLVISVNGIGPKGGLAILSSLSVNELRFAVASSDVKAISKAQGIGKKTAEKLIIELKDKLHIEDALGGAEDTENSKANVNRSANTNEVIQALVALGYDSSSALKAVSQVVNSSDMEVEELLKLALKNIMF